MPPATAPLTGTTASRSSGSSGESDSSPENISGHDSASAAPPDDGESSMVSRGGEQAAAGRAPRLRERDDGAVTNTGAAAAGADAAHLLPRRPLPEDPAPQPTCKRRVGPGPGGGSSVAPSGGRTRLRCGSGADAVHRGARARLPPPRSLPQPRRARPRTARARTEDGARPGRAGLGGVAARGRPL